MSGESQVEAVELSCRLVLRKNAWRPICQKRSPKYHLQFFTTWNILYMKQGCDQHISMLEYLNKVDK